MHALRASIHAGARIEGERARGRLDGSGEMWGGRRRLEGGSSSYGGWRVGPESVSPVRSPYSRSEPCRFWYFLCASRV